MRPSQKAPIIGSLVLLALSFVPAKASATVQNTANDVAVVDCTHQQPTPDVDPKGFLAICGVLTSAFLYGGYKFATDKNWSPFPS